MDNLLMLLPGMIPNLPMQNGGADASEERSVLGEFETLLETFDVLETPALEALPVDNTKEIEDLPLDVFVQALPIVQQRALPQTPVTLLPQSQPVHGEEQPAEVALERPPKQQGPSVDHVILPAAVEEPHFSEEAYRPLLEPQAQVQAAVPPMRDVPLVESIFHVRHGPPAEAPKAAAVAHQVVEVVVEMEAGEAEISLNPPELGEVKIIMKLEETEAKLTLLFERPETLDLMRRHGESLIKSLESMGYKEVEMNFASGGQSNRGNEQAPPAYFVLEEEEAAAGSVAFGQLDVRV